MSEMTHGGRPRRLGPSLTRCWRALWQWAFRPVHRRAVHQLHVAAETQDGARLRVLLAPTVSVVIDSGTGDASGVRVFQGIDDARVILEHGFARKADVLIQERSVNSQAGLIVSRAGTPTACVAVDFTGPLITLIWVRLEPAALRHWNSVYA